MSQKDLEIFQLDEHVFEAEFDDKDDWNDFFSTFKYGISVLSALCHNT